MNAIRIRTHVGSETMHLPELRPWIGKDVEIIVLPDVDDDLSLPRDLSAFFAAVGKIDVDDTAVANLRVVSKL